MVEMPALYKLTLVLYTTVCLNPLIRRTETGEGVASERPLRAARVLNLPALTLITHCAIDQRNLPQKSKFDGIIIYSKLTQLLRIKLLMKDFL